MMKADTHMQAILDQLAKFNAPPIENLSPENARNTPTVKNAVEEMAAQSALVRSKNLVMPSLPEPVEHIDHILIPTDSGEVLARVFSPAGDGPFPVIVYFHGGGWVIANLDVYEPTCRCLCNATESIVFSVAYRQAPEHKFPAAPDDAYAALQWIMRNAARLNGDSARVAVAGESAGANLAAVACLRARDEGGLMPVAQLLVYPVTDSQMNSPSYTEQANAKPLNAAMMHWFWNHYLADLNEGQHAYASPLRAPDLSGLPPATVITAELDPLRDEGEAYAQRLADAGIDMALRRYNGVTHEFFGLAAAVEKAKEAVDFAVERLNRAFDQGKSSSHKE
ncbi:alpha/beta hydrolase [Alkanindiges sp. WGS2144]|uniref:alpha/beta hydrolase n=1 Tax=Alkanindiges sp. WGS2144 TaxID=3366808 RepID=UPI003751DBE6